MELKQKTLKQMTDAEKAENPEYAEFLEKFEDKHTTDDCFTPDNIYNVVASHVSDTYGLDSSKFVRPFYPGGDYENFDYPNGCVVVDNPPFSIISKIVKFYSENDIKFFIFAPHLTLFSTGYNVPGVSYIVTETDIIYNNGAKVATSFVTNLEPLPCLKAEASLHDLLKSANKENAAKIFKKFPKYNYPRNVLTVAHLSYLAKKGVNLSIELGKCRNIRRLDGQISHKKAIFGSGYIISDDAAEALDDAKDTADKTVREDEDNNTMRWKLSNRELEIVNELNKS